LLDSLLQEILEFVTDKEKSGKSFLKF